MQIGFDALAAFLDPLRGFGRVTRSLAEALLQLLPGDVVVFAPAGSAVPDAWHKHAARIVSLTRPRRGAFLFDAPAWAVTLRRHPVDVLHLPAWGVPHGLPLPVVATFYDATPLRFASPPEPWRRARARMAIRSLTRATAVHAISDYARREFLENFAFPEEKVVAVPLGVEPSFAPAPQAEPPRHLLFVGGGDPHKNLELLLTMLAMPEAQGLPPLAVAGPAANDTRLADAVIQGRVRPLPGPSDAELVALYRRALALLIPSRNEGFGLPALEAMACGCPVVAARAGALPEVCGEAALLLDPEQPRAWLDALLTLQAEPLRREALVQAGVARARTFTWERSARELLAVYRAATLAESSRS
jgi:glycosyltransferase involved in cell wall biosynthesis